MNEKIDSYISRSLISYGNEVNNNRQLPLIVDGLKPVFRRAIVTAMKYGGKMTKTSAISGFCIATLHPHSSDSVDAVISSLVRWGIFEGQGSHGMKMIYGDDLSPAAPRYTEARLDPRWMKIFSPLMDYVPYKEAELEGNQEPVYLPTPIPLILLFGGLGIGFGANCRIPMFTAKSLYEAMMADDPKKLEASGGLILDKGSSELMDLWTKGLGRLTYKYKVEKCGLPSGYGSMISGSAEIFKPYLDGIFKDEIAKGQIYLLDQTDGTIPKLFVGKSYNVRAISLDDIQNKCEKACTYTRMFRLTVTDGKQCYCIPLREWLRETYLNYLKLIDTYKKDKISKLWFDYDVYDWLPTVAKYLYDHRDQSDEDVAKGTKCKLDVVKVIMRKSISTLRITDSTDKLKGIKKQIKEFENLNPENYVKDIINEF